MFEARPETWWWTQAAAPRAKAPVQVEMSRCGSECGTAGSPLYARAQDEDVHRRAIPGGEGRAAAVLPAEPWTQDEGSSRELMVWAAMSSHTWIRLARSFVREIPQRRPVDLWLQHNRCCG